MGGDSGFPIKISIESDNDNEPVGIVLQKFKEDLLECLEKTRSPGLVATSEERKEFVNPGLTVAGALIPLPLVPRDAETIRGVCRQAPFGKGDETVVDTSVRKTWELDHSQFKCANPDWHDFVESLLDDASENLGMSQVKAEPYKLLLYDEGSFFKRHKDSEKVPGMIGTLVICLPSKHKGGSVRLFHGKTYVFDTDKTSEFSLTSLAWFSDVTHEVEPLESGYRLVLTYNIIHTGGIRMSAKLAGKQLTNIRILLTEWRSRLPGRDMLVYLLDHKYTESSLSLKNLKGRDRAVCQSLYEAGLDCDFTIFLARLNRTQSGCRYIRSEEEDTELEEVKTCDGYTLCTSMPVEEEDIIGGPEDLWPLDAADSADEGDFTGNESMPATLRYHDAAVIIAPVQKLGFIFDRPDPRGIMNLLNRNLNDRPGNKVFQIFVLGLLERTLSNSRDGTVLSEALAIAVKLEWKSLYRVAVHASLRDSDARNQVLKTILGLVKEWLLKNPLEKLNWDFWLNDMVTGTAELSLTTLQKTLRSLDSLLQDDGLKYLKSSFEKWKDSIMMNMLAFKSSLTIDDHNFLTYLIFTPDTDISSLINWLTPDLARRGSKELICAILRTIYIQRNTKRPDRAADTFRRILEGSAKKLALQIEDFPHTNLATRTDGIRCIAAKSVKGVLEIIDEALDMGLTAQGVELLDASCTNIHQSCQAPRTKQLPCSVVIQQFLESLLSVIRKHRVTPPDSVKNMYIAFIRNILFVDPPKCPKPPRGWAHKPRGCNPACRDCNVLDAFLKKEDEQTDVFRMAERRRAHLERLLPADLFQCRTDKKRVPHGLVVTKLGTEFQKDMQDYKDKLKIFEDRVRGLRCKEVKSLLGEELYNELVMLKDIPDSDGAKQLGKPEKKREAEEELEGSTPSRLRVEE
ncbi:hypothetical protein F5Y13DRAFT_197797 [Hypoxylon sp. FL1857]|nr:hypothetical protein F5Y13DRAFT_197797 [Hypoxylon sp. FL1857]